MREWCARIRGMIEIFKEMDLRGWVVCDSKSVRWWGGLSKPEEVAISAILVQRTRWENVEVALKNLRSSGMLDLDVLANVKAQKLQEIIKPVGFKRKAIYLIEFARRILEIGGFEELMKMDDVTEFLKSIRGIGEETADAIALFALNRRTIPISSYMLRVLGRFFLETYNRSLKVKILECLDDLQDLKLLYAGVTSIGRDYCKTNPICKSCPLRVLCSFNLRKMIVFGSSNTE